MDSKQRKVFSSLFGLNFLSVTELVVGVQNEGQCLC